MISRLGLRRCVDALIYFDTLKTIYVQILDLVFLHIADDLGNPFYSIQVGAG